MSWTDEDIDRLFKDAGDDLSFEYKQEYWNEVEAMLPKRKKRDFLWFIAAFGSMGVLLLGVVYSTAQFDQERTLNAAEGNQWQLEKNLTEVNTTQSKETGHNKSNARLVALFQNENGTSSLSGIRNNAEVIEFIGVPFDVSGMNLSGYYPFYSGYQMPMLFVNSDPTVEASSGSEALVLPTNPLVSELDKSLAASDAMALGKLPARVNFYLEGNVGLSQSLITPSNQLFARYGGGLGINIHTNKWTTTLGLNASVSNHNDIELSRVAKYYSYGSQMVTHTINYKALYAFEGVLSVTRNFGRHGVIVGIRPSYLMTTKVDYTRTDDQEEVSQRKELVGFTDGINRFGLKPTVGYSFMLNEKWNAGVNLGVQMMETFKTDFITKDNNRFPIDGQFYIRRNIQLRK